MLASIWKSTFVAGCALVAFAVRAQEGSIVSMRLVQGGERHLQVEASQPAMAGAVRPEEVGDVLVWSPAYVSVGVEKGAHIDVVEYADEMPAPVTGGGCSAKAAKPTAATLRTVLDEMALQFETHAVQRIYVGAGSAAEARLQSLTYTLQRRLAADHSDVRVYAAEGALQATEAPEDFQDAPLLVRARAMTTRARGVGTTQGLHATRPKRRVRTQTCVKPA